MPYTRQQFARLSDQIARIERKFANAKAHPMAAPRISHESSARWFIEEWSEGQVVRNEFGEHFQTERLFAGHKPHGSADVGALADLPHDLLDALGENHIPAAAPHR